MLIISGPTGSGKTELAQKLGRPIFNADAYQFYKEIPILSNQPESDLKNFRFLADRSIAEPTNAGTYARDSLAYLNAEGIWVGIGLYLSAALYGLDEDRKKGTPFQGEPRVFFKMIVLEPDRKQLYENLNARVDQMCEKGAFDEARKIFELIESGRIVKTNPVLKAIGLQHCIRHFEGEWSFEETLRLWKRDTRRLAKRQLTWLRKFSPPSNHCKWVKTDEVSATEILEFFHSPN